MIANSAFLAAMVLMLIIFGLMDALEFLEPYKRLIFSRHLDVIVPAGSLAQFGIFFALLLGLSYLSWRFFEVPMQAWLNRWPRHRA